MKEYVRIQSTTTIIVTKGLEHEDVTNIDAHVPDRLKVNPTWPLTSVLIKEGTNMYPSEIVEWNSVKALERAKIITIGSYEAETTDEFAIKQKQELRAGIEEAERQTKSTRKRKAKEVTLENISEE